LTLYCDEEQCHERNLGLLLFFNINFQYIEQFLPNVNVSVTASSDDEERDESRFTLHYCKQASIL